MNLLLDTQVFLWFIGGDSRLSRKAMDAIEDGANRKAVSAASLWEIAIKISLGKLKLAAPLKDILPRQIDLNGFDLLYIHVRHLWRVCELPFHHRDPFDRLLVAQCEVDGMTVASAYPIFDRYGVRRIG